MSAYTSTGKRKSSQTHATRTHTCMCGKVCRGNGGWSSHKKTCPSWADYRAKRATRQAGNT